LICAPNRCSYAHPSILGIAPDAKPRWDNVFCERSGGRARESSRQPGARESFPRLKSGLANLQSAISFQIESGSKESRNLRDFISISNIGISARTTDHCLQSAIKNLNVVVPVVQRIEQGFPKAKTAFLLEFAGVIKRPQIAAFKRLELLLLQSSVISNMPILPRRVTQRVTQIFRRTRINFRSFLKFSFFPPRGRTRFAITDRASAEVARISLFVVRQT
jgi:hypothetical protein